MKIYFGLSWPSSVQYIVLSGLLGRPSSILIVNMFFLFTFQNKEEKNFVDF